jgi:hypothetical protein
MACATLVMTNGAVAQPLSVIGGEGARTLVLHLCGVNPKRSRTTAEALASGTCRSVETSDGDGRFTISPGPVLVGSLTLAVANASTRPERIAVLYIRNDGATARLPGTYSYVYLAGASSRGGRSLTIAPHATAVLPLHFALTPGKPSSALEGTLDVVLNGSRQVIAVPLKATVPAPPGLRLEPGELTLSTDRGDDHPTTILTLVGPGAAAFASSVDTRASFVLHDTNDHEVTLTLGDFGEEGSGVASAKLSIASNPEPGAYKGEVTLFSLSPAAPRLTLKVNSHRSVVFAIALVLLGVLIGGLAPRLYALNQRRDTLFHALGDARRRFQAAAQKLPPDARRAIWSLDDLAETDSLPRAQIYGCAPGRLPGVEALYAKIAKARNDRDLDEDTGAVLEVIARIQRWLRLAPTVWKLTDVVAEESPRDEAGWRKSATWRDTRLLQECLLREPPNAAATDDLVARVLWQILWYRGFAHLYAQAEARPAWHSVLGTLEKQLSKKSVLERTAAERDELSFALERLGEELDAQLPRDGYFQLPADCLELSDSPELTVQWRTTPNLFTGWATVDGTSWRNLRTQAVERGRVRTPRPLSAAEPPSPPQSGPSPSPDERLRRFASTIGSGVLQLILPLVAASVFYAVTTYNETWGSLTDIFTALTAGFIGKVLIDYGTLSVFQSRRLSATGKAPTTPAGAPPPLRQ